MAGTDGTRVGSEGAGPVVVLVRPQLGENIGAAARAMLNCGLTDLRLVAPRDGWPSETARASASGADRVLDAATVHETTREAVADLRFVVATTARSRDMVKPVLTPSEAVVALRERSEEAAPVGVLFGPERTGLSNEDVSAADAIVSVPLNPGFQSLNLAQAVLVVAYEWHRLSWETPLRRLETRGSRPATLSERDDFLDHLVAQLDAGGFFRPPEKRPVMVRNLRNVFTRAELTEQEVRTLHGVVVSLSGRRRPREPST